MIPVLVVLATGYFILQPLIEPDTSMPVSASACLEVLRVAGADAIRCEGEQTETLATSGLAGTDTRDDSPRGSAGGAHQNESSRGSSRSRGLTDADTAAEALRRPPHMTLADRCDAGIVDLGLHCNAGAQPTEKRRDTAEPALMSSISGRVMGSDGFGLNGVTVIASPVPGSDADQSPNSGAASVRYRTVSDSVGLYSFRRLPDGDYTIRNNEHGPYPATRISAHTGVDYADLVLREKRTFVVEGRVVAATGEPLERVTVLPIVLGVPSVRTDDRGRYRLPITLEPDVSRLTLRFQLPGFRETYATVPAPSVVETDVQAFDAVMQPLEYTTSVIGTVTTTEGVPLVGRIVELRPVTEQRRYDAVTNVDGEFRFPAIEARVPPARIGRTGP
jgi:hypothetical protein